MHADKTILLHAQAENLRTENTNFNTLNFNTAISKDILGCFMRHQTNHRDKILAQLHPSSQGTNL